jgi:hypothetical protein
VPAPRLGRRRWLRPGAHGGSSRPDGDPWPWPAEGGRWDGDRVQLRRRIAGQCGICDSRAGWILVLAKVKPVPRRRSLHDAASHCSGEWSNGMTPAFGAVRSWFKSRLPNHSVLSTHRICADQRMRAMQGSHIIGLADVSPAPCDSRGARIVSEPLVLLTDTSWAPATATGACARPVAGSVLRLSTIRSP